MYNFLKLPFFPPFSLFQILSKYKYTLAHFQKVFSKKLDKLFSNEHIHVT